jgi:hypothetical protein
MMSDEEQASASVHPKAVAGRGLTLLALSALACFAVGFGAGVGAGYGIFHEDVAPVNASGEVPAYVYDELFSQLDADQRGSLTVDEISSSRPSGGNATSLTEEQKAELVALLDVDGDGSISRSEFDDSIDEAMEGGLGNWLAGCDWNDDECYDNSVYVPNPGWGLG